MLPMEGRLIRLRDVRLADLPAWERLRAPDRPWYRFDAPWGGPPTTDLVTAERIRLAETIEAGTFAEPRVRLAIADAATDAYIGTVGRYFKSRETDWAAVGIGIHDETYWGGGRGTEALGLWCGYLFEAFPTWRRLTTETWTGNAPMMRVAEKLGFTLEARYREARPWQGGVYDAVGYGMLRGEWAARYPDGFAASVR